MATTRLKDFAKTTSTVASDDFHMLDGASNGSQKISRNNLRADLAAAFTAAPTTYDICPLNSGTGKIDATYLPTGADTAKGAWDADNTTITTLSDGTGTAGDYYDITDANGGTIDQGGGTLSINGDSVSVGDVIKYDGSNWYIVPAVANVLDGSATAADGRDALSVNSKDEDAQANALKVTAPALYFNGSSSVVTVADDSKFTFSDGTDDLPLTISGWINVASNAVNFSLFAMWYNFREVIAYVDTNGKLTFGLSDGTNDTYALGSTTIPLNQWTHVSICYAGAGPNSANGFDANQNGTTMYVNGKAETVTPTNNNNYGGLVERTQAQLIGGYGSYFGKGSIRDLKIFNRSLTADEVAELARGNDLGFSEEFGGANGGTYTSTFVGTANGFTAVNGTVNHSTSVGGESNALRLTLDGTTGGHYLQKTGVFTRGKRYRVKGRYYVPTNSHVDGIYFVIGTSGVVEVVRAAAPTLDSWIDFSVEVVANATADTDRLLVYALDGNSTTITDPGADDVIYILDLVVTEIGTLADFRAEDYNESASKLLDRSSNNFVGVGTSVTLTGNQRHISADTIDLKNLPTSSAGLSAGEVWSNSGVLTVV